MTDKQIIIDGIEIYKCRNAKRSIFGIDVECQLGGDCSQRPDCDYKQLKRKEQECEELKIEVEKWESAFTLDTKMLDNADCRKNELEQQIDQLKAENDELKEQLERADEDIKAKCTRCAMTNQLDEQLDQLKAEVKSKTEYIQEQRDIINQYSKEIEMYKKCQGKRASKREEELKAENKHLNDLLNQALKELEEMRELKDTESLQVCILTRENERLKELLAQDRCFQDKSHKCVKSFYIDERYKQAIEKIKEIIHFNKTNRLSGGACISIEQILQICDEVNDV